MSPTVTFRHYARHSSIAGANSDVVETFACKFGQMNVSRTTNPAARSKRDTYHHGNLEDAVLAVARNHIETKDIGELSFRGVAAEIGVSHRALYRIFADREALLWRVAQGGFAELLEACKAAVVGKQGADALRAYMSAYARFALEHFALYKTMYSLPLMREFTKQSPVSRQLQELFHLAASYAQFGSSSPTEVRDRVNRLWAQVHGMVEFFHCGALSAKSNEHALTYIDSATLTFLKREDRVIEYGSK